MTLNREMQHFLEALELAGEERAKYVAAIEDEAVRSNVVELLETHEDQETAALPTLEDPSANGSVPLEGKTVDGYRILRQVAEGGMGVVYLAEQERPRRKVALKIVHAAASRETLRRFEHEAEILARLEHPGIARIYGTGTAETSVGTLPYLALEWVDGVPLDEYARRFAHGVDVEQQSEILISICDAVSFAHSQGVIHRDLKPSNILVDAEGRPKVLDFGIARITDESPAQTLATRTGQLLGTLSYMSPEQLSGRAQEVDTRSDVYALGIIGFELLSGRRPVDIEGLSITRAIHELVDREPSRLSRIDARLRGDIEVVIAKALRKDRAERYQSVHELGSDLRRILSHEPITARAPSTSYQLRKLVRRHRIVFASLAVVLVALTTGLVLALQSKAKADAARSSLEVSVKSEKAAKRTAEQRADSMRNVASYIAELLLLAGPAQGGQKTIDLAQLIEAISGDGVDNTISTDPLAAGLMLFNIASIYADRWDRDRALELLDLARERLEASELATLVDRVKLERLSYRIQRIAKKSFAEQQATIDRARALSAQLEGDDRYHDVMLLAAHADLIKQQGNLEKSESMTRAAIAAAEELPRMPLRDLGALHQQLGITYYFRGQYAAAARHYDDAREHYDRGEGTAIHRIHVRRLLCDCYRKLDKTEEAVRAAADAVDLAERDGTPVQLGLSLDKLANARSEAGDSTGALEAWRRAIPLLRSGSPGNKRLALLAQMDRAWALGQSGDLETALREMQEATRALKSAYGGKSTMFAVGLQRTARLELKRQKPDRKRALKLANRALAIWRDSPNKRQPDHAMTARVVTGIHISTKDWRAAEVSARRAVTLNDACRDFAGALDSRVHLASALKMQDRVREAVELFDSVRDDANLMARMSRGHFQTLATWAASIPDAERAAFWKSRVDAKGSK